MFVGHDGSAPGVQLLQHHRHALRAQLHGILPELFPQLAQLFGRHRVKFRLAPQVAAHLTRQATQGKSLCKAFILQQSGLCCICRDCHGKACAPALSVCPEYALAHKRHKGKQHKQKADFAQRFIAPEIHLRNGDVEIYMRRKKGHGAYKPQHIGGVFILQNVFHGYSPLLSK